MSRTEKIGIALFVLAVPYIAQPGFNFAASLLCAIGVYLFVFSDRKTKYDP